LHNVFSIGRARSVNFAPARLDGLAHLAGRLGVRADALNSNVFHAQS
jgi:hypothetical protein